MMSNNFPPIIFWAIPIEGYACFSRSARARVTAEDQSMITWQHVIRFSAFDTALGMPSALTVMPMILIVAFVPI